MQVGHSKYGTTMLLKEKYSASVFGSAFPLASGEIMSDEWLQYKPEEQGWRGEWPGGF